MLESTVLHHSRGGGGDGDVVGISWKTTTKSQSSSPSLVVTCAHQVVVYKPGEHRRIHQWSFKPSAATVLSHPAVYLPSACRYVGVQQGSTIVSWRESEQSVRRPLSTQAACAVQAVHACPRLGDYFVAVLVSGGVALYKAELQRVAYTAEDIGEKRSVEPKIEPKRLPRVVWSGVFGETLAVLAKVGLAERLTTFALSLDSSEGSGSAAAASVTLVSSHVLTKPARLKGAAGSPAPEIQDEEPSACSAAFLRGLGWQPGDGVVMVVAWRTRQGPMWTKIVVGARGIRKEFARSAVPMGAAETNAVHVAPNGVVTAALTNGHKKAKAHKGKISVPAKQALIAGGTGSGAGMFSSIPAVADADGGRLFVHSGGTFPRLSIWDAAYGILLEDDRAPETVEFGADCAMKRAASVMVSGDGSHLALTVAGRVLVCHVPVRETGTLSSLLRRKRPSSAIKATSAGGLERAFPAIDLARNASAAGLLDNTGAMEAATWNAGVVTPFRDAETRVIQSLEDAARRKDSCSFERIVQEHLQQLRTGVAIISGDDIMGAGAEAVEDGRRKRRRARANSTVGAVTTAGVELCLADPKAALWGALAMLLQSGSVSARQHRGLVKRVIEHAPHLLDVVMIHVPDLPESDAVRILGHVLSEASILASSAAAGNTSTSMLILSKASGNRRTDELPGKRARSQGCGDDCSEDVNERSPQGNASPGLDIKKSPSRKSAVEAVMVRSEGKGGRGRKSRKKNYEKQIPAAGSEAHVDLTEKGINGTAIASVSNGHVNSTVMQDRDGVMKQGGEGKGDESEKNKLWKRAAALAERAVRVAVALPYNEAFLRSALARLSHGEIIIVLKVLTRLLSEELAGGPEGNRATSGTKGPPVRTEAVLGWASAVLDSHFTRLAIKGAADPELLGTLKALKETSQRQAACCEMLSQVRSLVDEVGRRHAAMTAAAEEGRRDSKRDLFSLRVLRF